MNTNYCDCSDVLATCKMPDNLINQALCDFSNGPTLGNSCIYLREEFGNHCDNADAQHEARHGSKGVAKPLTEEEVFDVVNPRTWPTY